MRNSYLCYNGLESEFMKISSHNHKILNTVQAGMWTLYRISIHICSKIKNFAFYIPKMNLHAINVVEAGIQKIYFLNFSNNLKTLKTS